MNDTTLFYVRFVHIKHIYIIIIGKNDKDKDFEQNVVANLVSELLHNIKVNKICFSSYRHIELINIFTNFKIKRNGNSRKDFNY